MTETKKRLMCDEIVINNFHVFAKQLCQEVPELKALALVTHWNFDASNLPSGTVYVDTEAADNDPMFIFGLINQTMKILHSQIRGAEQMIEEYKSMYTNLLKELDVIQKELEEAKVQSGKTKTSTTKT